MFREPREERIRRELLVGGLEVLVKRVDQENVVPELQHLHFDRLFRVLLELWRAEQSSMSVCVSRIQRRLVRLLQRRQEDDKERREGELR